MRVHSPRRTENLCSMDHIWGTKEKKNSRLIRHVLLVDSREESCAGVGYECKWIAGAAKPRYIRTYTRLFPRSFQDHSRGLAWADMHMQNCIYYSTFFSLLRTSSTHLTPFRILRFSRYFSTATHETVHQNCLGNFLEPSWCESSHPRASELVWWGMLRQNHPSPFVVLTWGGCEEKNIYMLQETAAAGMRVARGPLGYFAYLIPCSSGQGRISRSWFPGDGYNSRQQLTRQRPGIYVITKSGSILWILNNIW